ncbi:MAG: heme o synthase [Pseudomonadota bacterium]
MEDLAIRLTGQGAAAPAAARPVDLSTWRDYVDLLKPRVMMLVVFTGIAGMVAAPGALTGAIHPIIAFSAILALTFGAGAAGAINMWFDRDIDGIMTRTATRPIPAGRVAPDAGLTFSIFMAAASVFVMGMAVNWFAAGLLAFAIWFYAVFYTMWLKRRTPQNIVIGGAAGAFPPLIGWAAVTGDVSLLPALLFAIIFLWTPPHFWALALVAKTDYGAAGVPMLPNVAGKAATRRQILGYTIVLAIVSVLPWFLGYTGAIYGIAASVLGGLYCISSLEIFTRKTASAAWRGFGYSIFYLFALFGALIVDKAGLPL